MPMDRTNRKDDAISFTSGRETLRRLLRPILACLVAGTLMSTQGTREPPSEPAESADRPWIPDAESTRELAMALRGLMSGDLPPGKDIQLPLQPVLGPVELTAPSQTRRTEKPPAATILTEAVSGLEPQPASEEPGVEAETPIARPVAGPVMLDGPSQPPSPAVDSMQPRYGNPEESASALPSWQPPRHVPGSGTIEGTIEEVIVFPMAARPNQPGRKPGGMSGRDDSNAADARRLLKPIRQVNVELAPPKFDFHPDRPDPKDQSRLPLARELFADEADAGDGFGYVRPWAGHLVCWAASGLCHRPLYFEEINLERYGYSFGLAQPAVSAAHFFGRIPALPYLMTVDAPLRCVSTLGHYRPGTPTPLYLHRVPIDPLAAAVQGGVVTGLVYLVP